MLLKLSVANLLSGAWKELYKNMLGLIVDKTLSGHWLHETLGFTFPCSLDLDFALLWTYVHLGLSGLTKIMGLNFGAPKQPKILHNPNFM